MKQQSLLKAKSHHCVLHLKKAQLKAWKVYNVRNVILRLICYLINFSFKEAGDTTAFLSIVTFFFLSLYFLYFLSWKYIIKIYV